MLLTVPNYAIASRSVGETHRWEKVIEESETNTNRWRQFGVEGDTVRTPGDTTCKSSTEEQQQLTQTALPLTGKKIVIDAGHGGKDTGAIHGKVQEKTLTLAIATKLKKMLEDQGATVVMTRSDDSTVSLQERVDVTVAACPDIFVSVHVNAHTNRSLDGIEAYYWRTDSKELATTLYNGLVRDLSTRGKWVAQEEFFVVHWSPVPAVLMEVGYMSNPAKRALLVTDSYQDKVAKSLADGIVRYFQNVKPGANQGAPGKTTPSVQQLDGRGDEPPLSR